jgi:hypothetical protein
MAPDLRPTRRWTRAALACSLGPLLLSSLTAGTLPRQLRRSTASLNHENSRAHCAVWFCLGIRPNETCRPARYSKLPTINGLTYPRARKILLNAGWRPLKTNSSPTDVDISYGNGRLFWRRGYVELEGCSGTCVAACSFLFKDRFGNRLRVTTEGEELPRDNAHAHVNGFHFVCV